MTTEYTPTTTEVRERFVDGFPMDTWVLARAECAAEFDRWLAAHDARVRAVALREAAQAQAALIMIRDHAHAVLAVSDRGVSTHYEGCWVHHRDCVAAWVADIAEVALDEMGVPR